MKQTSPVLHLLCGKIAAGKSTLASNLSATSNSILISEDQWLKALFSDQMETGADYVRCSERLRSIMKPHVAMLLTAGTSVVLDFAANTVGQRRWMHDIIRETGAAHQLHFLDVPDDVCLDRLRARNATGVHEFSPTEEQFQQFSRHFVAPTPEEGFEIVTHRTN